MSNLYRNDTTRELGLFLTPPGAGYTVVPDMPAGPRSAVVQWWRDLDLDTADATWHPSVITGDVETPAPPGVGGRGINILPEQYASFEALPSAFKSSSLTYEVIDGGKLNAKSLRLNAAAPSQWIAFAPGDWSWPIKLTGNKRWMLSVYTRAGVVSLPYKLTFSASINGSSAEYSEHAVTTSATANTWTRQVVGIDLSSYEGTMGRIGFKFDSPTASPLQIDAVMLEEWVGDVLAPSAWVDGV